MTHVDITPDRSARSFRVILFGMTAIIGLGVTFLVSAPDLHRAMISAEQPVTLTWAELVRDGNGDAALNSVTEAGLETIDFAAHGIDVAAQNPGGSVEAGLMGQMTEHLHSFADESLWRFRVQRLLSMPTTEYIKVLPRGYTPERVPAVVIVPIRQQEIQAAVSEISSSESLTGYFSRYRPSPTVSKLATLMKVDLPSPAHEKQYVYERADAAPALAVALILFLFSSITVVVSLVICGSGAPSKLSALFSPIQSLISLLGFPLRHGRANLITRSAYLIGASWIAWQGYQFACDLGGFGRTDGYLFEISIGACMILVGAAGIVGVLVSMRSASRRGAGFAKPEGAAPVAMVETTPEIVDRISVTGGSDARTRRYSEVEFEVPQAYNLSSQAVEMCEFFERLDFESPLVIVFRSETESGLFTLQLGCENTVTAYVTDRSEDAHTELVSVLADGFCVISAMSDDEDQTLLREYVGIRKSGPRTPVLELLSAHLELTCTVAAERQTTVVICDSGETRDVYRYKQRISAELRRVALGESIEVREAVYGRFTFPCRSVPELQPVMV